MELPEIIGGKYRPRSVLGFGATGTVYCVEHTFTGDLLALKVLQPHLSASAEAIARFKGEARMAAKLRSRHVVRIFDADVARELGGAPYLVMELLEGSNLERVAEEGASPPEVVVKWLRQAAVPLERAHRLGIVHRDLKPENLFLTERDDGEPILKILDFGIARIAESPGMTKSGQLFGTPLYMAPEQARAVPEQVGPPTDIFALGLIAYKLLTGSEYRAEAGLAQMLHQILQERLQTPTEKGHSLGEAFDAWFLRACDPDPSLRFTSVTEQVEALASAFGISEEVPTSSAAPESPRLSWTPPPPMRTARPSQNVALARAALPGGGPASLRATTIDASLATSLKLQSIPTLSGADVEEFRPRPNGWRLGFFALCTLGLAIGIGGWVRRAPHGLPPAAAPPATACPALPEATAAAPPAVEDPRRAVVPVVAAEPAPAPLPPPSTKFTAVRGSSADPSRAAVPRTASAAASESGTSTTSKHAVEDDPLSDQK